MINASVSFLSKTPCELGEGPFYCERRETLYWFDIVGRKRHAFDFKSRLETHQSIPEMASAMAVIDERHDLVFTESGLWRLELGTGCWIPVCNIEVDDDKTRSNDARVHPSGAMWLGTMGKSAETGAGAIYHYRAGTVTKLFSDITIPNAICFSPAGDIAYFTDTKTGKLMRVSVNVDDGLPVDKPEVHFAQPEDDVGGIDGAVCDRDGRVWNARWGAACVDVYTPEGKRTESIELPVSQPSCPAFVGANRMAVTSAFEGMDATARNADSDAGRVVLLDFEIPIKPRFEPRVVI
ncbi:MAG: SMP-30/gluconolactonase/LRE family protein [Pseudomonadota bacterium]